MRKKTVTQLIYLICQPIFLIDYYNLEKFKRFNSANMLFIFCPRGTDIMRFCYCEIEMYNQLKHSCGDLLDIFYPGEVEKLANKY